MAGWYSDLESDDEPLNIKMFARKSFAFRGFSEDEVDRMKKFVEQIGGICDDFPKYILTSKEFYNSLDLMDTKNYDTLYNITYLRDCVDANRCLNIEHYRFGSKCIEKYYFKDFEPCCKNFHFDKESCRVCDPFFLQEVQKPKRRSKSFIKPENVDPVIKNESKIKSKSALKNRKLENGEKRKRKERVVVSSNTPWEHWELQLMLDFTISKNLFYWIKSPSLFKRMHAEGLLNHRSVESMRSNFRNNIIYKLNSFNVAESIKRKMRRINNLIYPGRSASKLINKKSLKKFQNKKV